jgi:hypothetical protein
MRYSVEMNSGVLTCITKCYKDWFSHLKLTGEYIDTQTTWRSHDQAFLFFLQNKESKKIRTIKCKLHCDLSLSPTEERYNKSVDDYAREKFKGTCILMY